MKRLVTILAAMMLITGLWGQSPEKISYQAIIRNAVDKLVVNTSTGMQISILKGSIEGTPVYVELHSPTTNANGLISVEIGEGTVITGSFSAIDWSDGPYFIKTETDPAGGTNYSITGTSQLLSVPYALYARDVENNEDDDADPSNELQTLSVKGVELTISEGNTINLPLMDTLWRENDSTIYALDENIGLGTDKANARLHVDNGAVVFSGNTGSVNISGEGTRFMWIPEKAAIRSGYVSGSNWDADSIGDYSGAFGYNTKASGYASFATGKGIAAAGDYTMAIALSDQRGLRVTEDNTLAVMGGKVGIGVTKPLSELDVKGVLRSSLNESRYMYFDGRHRDGNAYINYAGGSKMSRMGFQLNGSSIMSIHNNGNVGIGTTLPTEKLEVNGNLLVKGDIALDGVITGEISIDSVHVSIITGLLGQGFTMILPDMLNNYVLFEISGINLTEKVVIVSSLGHETERISVPWKIGTSGDTLFFEKPGLTMEYPIAFETGNTEDVNSLKKWFDTDLSPRSGSVVIKNLAGVETDRWNFYEYIPDSYEPGNDGRTRFTIIHNLLPDNIVRVKYEEGDFGSEHSYNPLTDKLMEISGVTHAGFTPAVEVDYRRRTITLTMDYPEGQGLALWSYKTAAGTETARSGSIIETTDGTVSTEISRRNYFECIPIKYELIYGFGQDIKLKARIVIAFGWWEDG